MIFDEDAEKYKRWEAQASHISILLEKNGHYKYYEVEVDEI